MKSKWIESNTFYQRILFSDSPYRNAIEYFIRQNWTIVGKIRGKASLRYYQVLRGLNSSEQLSQRNALLKFLSAFHECSEILSGYFLHIRKCLSFKSTTFSQSFANMRTSRVYFAMYSRDHNMIVNRSLSPYVSR